MSNQSEQKGKVIYYIKSLDDKYVYIGSTKHYESRMAHHKYHIQNFKDFRKLYVVMRGIGWDKLECGILDYAYDSEVLELEQYYKELLGDNLSSYKAGTGYAAYKNNKLESWYTKNKDDELDRLAWKRYCLKHDLMEI